jgi:hypothetical protein
MASQSSNKLSSMVSYSYFKFVNKLERLFPLVIICPIFEEIRCNAQSQNIFLRPSSFYTKWLMYYKIRKSILLQIMYTYF